MTIGLLWPAALVGLIGLVVPFLIHRVPRRQSVLRPFAALRFIGQHSAPRSQHQLSERWLLMLRLALISVLILWLALPQLNGWLGFGLQWRAVWPGVSPASLADPGRFDRSVWLTPGFPDTARNATPITAHNTASLLRELASQLPERDSLVVWVPAVLEGLDAQSLFLPREVEWKAMEASAAPPAAKPKLAVRFASNAPPSPWLDAALAAWQADPSLATEIDRAPADAPIPNDATAVLWIGDLSVTNTIGSLPVLEVPSAPAPQRADRADPWVSLTPMHAKLHGPLTPERYPAVLDPSFPHVLHDWLFRRAPQPTRANAASTQPSLSGEPLPRNDLDLRDATALLAALLLLIERLVATRTARLGRSA